MIFSKRSLVRDIELIKLEIRVNFASELVVFDKIFELGAIRCFSVSTPIQIERGKHAHIRSHQWFVSMSGRILVETFDGTHRSDLVLSKPNEVLSVPAGIWSTQIYDPNSHLLVFTDTKYEESDYIRELDAFKSWKFG